MKTENVEALVKIKSGLLHVVEGLNEMMDPPREAPPQNEAIETTPGIIEVKGMEADWVVSGLKWNGKHEARDQKALQDFLGFNPNDAEGGKSWCAGFWLKIFEELGFDVTELNLMATSFKTFGYEIDTLTDGAICVFEPKEDADFPIRHVGVVVDNCQKLFGGNQGNSAKRSNLQWYLENAELTAIRCPDGYKLLSA